MLEEHFWDQRPLRYFCMDESRWGLKTELGRRITLPGVKPIAPVQWHRANFWLYGAVEIPTASRCSTTSPTWTLSASSAFWSS